MRHIYRKVDVFCNGENCGKKQGFGNMTKKEIDKDLRKMGWTRNDVEDFCPDCSKKIKN